MIVNELTFYWELFFEFVDENGNKCYNINELSGTFFLHVCSTFPQANYALWEVLL